MIRAFFFFNDTATTEIYPLSLHDALPIWSAVSLETERVAAGDDAVRRDVGVADALAVDRERPPRTRHDVQKAQDRKSTRLNSSHSQISYAVFCLKKK